MTSEHLRRGNVDTDSFRGRTIGRLREKAVILTTEKSLRRKQLGPNVELRLLASRIVRK